MLIGGVGLKTREEGALPPWGEEVGWKREDSQNVEQKGGVDSKIQESANFELRGGVGLRTGK